MVFLTFFLLPQITRAMVAARAFIQGLETGRDVVSEALKVRGGLSVGGAQGGRGGVGEAPCGRVRSQLAGETCGLPLSASRPWRPE